MPELKWIIGDHDITPELLESAKNSSVSVQLYVAKTQFVEIGKFKFVSPPPPEEP